jgi:hypothetical protein
MLDQLFFASFTVMIASRKTTTTSAWRVKLSKASLVQPLQEVTWWTSCLSVSTFCSRIDHITEYFIVKYVPEGLPGAGFKRMAREWKKSALDLRDRPFELLKAVIASHGLSLEEI